VTTQEILTAIQTSSIAHAVSKSNHMIGAVLQIVHVIGIILLLAALVVLSLRLTGLAFAKQSVRDVGRDALRLMRIGIALALVSGVLMFTSAPQLYWKNEAFQIKMVLFVLAIIVQAAFVRRVATQDTPSAGFARLSATLAIVLWFGVGLAGRVIGFL
jgi:uncharacterized membrane protein